MNSEIPSTPSAPLGAGTLGTRSRRRERAFVSQMLVYALVTICSCGGVGLGTVWLRQKISVSANHAKRLETEIDNLRRQIDGVDAEIATQDSAQLLKHHNEQWRLGLVPQMDSKVGVERVEDDPLRVLADKRRGQLLTESVRGQDRFRLASAR